MCKTCIVQNTKMYEQPTRTFVLVVRKIVRNSESTDIDPDAF